MNTINIRHYITTLIMALLPMFAAATPATLSVEDFTISAGETKIMLIDLNNPDTEVTLVQLTCVCQQDSPLLWRMKSWLLI